MVIDSFLNKPLFLRVCSTSLLKTLWEKENLLVTSKFSFSHSVFNPFRYPDPEDRIFNRVFPCFSRVFSSCTQRNHSVSDSVETGSPAGTEIVQRKSPREHNLRKNNLQGPLTLSIVEICIKRERNSHPTNTSIFKLCITLGTSRLPVRYLVAAIFLCVVFSPPIHVRKVVRGFGKKSFLSISVRKQGNT